MRTSLNEIQLIEGYILNSNQPQDALLFDALLIIDPHFAERVHLQKKVQAVVLHYGRKKIKAEINSVHEQLFNKPGHKGFRQRILNLFNER
jgi:hypothetical protein